MKKVSKFQEVVLPKRKGNHADTEKRSQNGKMGRGEDAFSGKITDDWEAIMERVEAIAARNINKGPSVSYPIHAWHGSLKAIKF